MTPVPHADRDGSEEPFWKEGDPGLAILPPYWLGTMKPIAPSVDWQARAEAAEHTLGIVKRLADSFPHSFGPMLSAILAGNEVPR